MELYLFLVLSKLYLNNNYRGENHTLTISHHPFGHHPGPGHHHGLGFLLQWPLHCPHCFSPYFAVVYS